MDDNLADRSVQSLAIAARLHLIQLAQSVSRLHPKINIGIFDEFLARF
ncbi:hypothetical protein [Bradyrhizobium sp.]